MIFNHPSTYPVFFKYHAILSHSLALNRTHFQVTPAERAIIDSEIYFEDYSTRYQDLFHPHEPPQGGGGAGVLSGFSPPFLVKGI